jgi:hypothetical protein
MKTTRCLCLNLNGQYLHKGEIEQIGLGNLAVIEGLASCRSGALWQGAMSNTNDKTIFTVAGGYNCQHSILPVSTFGVPKEVGLRAYQSGYFKPTPTEKAFFGIV